MCKWTAGSQPLLCTDATSSLSQPFYVESSSNSPPRCQPQVRSMCPQELWENMCSRSSPISSGRAVVVRRASASPTRPGMSLLLRCDYYSDSQQAVIGPLQQQCKKALRGADDTPATPAAVAAAAIAAIATPGVSGATLARRRARARNITDAKTRLDIANSLESMNTMLSVFFSVCFLSLRGVLVTDPSPRSGLRALRVARLITFLPCRLARVRRLGLMLLRMKVRWLRIMI